MAIKSDDSDLSKTWLKTGLGGNCDYYITLIFENEEGLKESKSVRISTSGGYTKSSRVKIAIAELHRALEEANLNDFPDDE
jgi:hypothetical protein